MLSKTLSKGKQLPRQLDKEQHLGELVQCDHDSAAIGRFHGGATGIDLETVAVYSGDIFCKDEDDLLILFNGEYIVTHFILAWELHMWIEPSKRNCHFVSVKRTEEHDLIAYARPLNTKL